MNLVWRRRIRRARLFTDTALRFVGMVAICTLIPLALWGLAVLMLI
jgi:hypothetical protein